MSCHLRTGAVVRCTVHSLDDAVFILPEVHGAVTGIDGVYPPVLLRRSQDVEQVSFSGCQGFVDVDGLGLISLFHEVEAGLTQLVAKRSFAMANELHHEGPLRSDSVAVGDVGPFHLDRGERGAHRGQHDAGDVLVVRQT